MVRAQRPGTHREIRFTRRILQVSQEDTVGFLAERAATASFWYTPQTSKASAVESMRILYGVRSLTVAVIHRLLIFTA